MTGGETYRTLSLFDEEPVSIAAGELSWVPVRRRLGIGAFGVNVYRAVSRGGPVVEDHVESPGQEELYVLLRGRAELVVGEEKIEMAVGSAVFVPQPEARRHAVALEEDTVILAIGGWRDRPYHSLPWEPIYLAQESMRDGDWAAAVDILEHEAGEHREGAPLRFRLACCHARLGNDELAIEELRGAIEANPDMRRRAEDEESFASLRNREDWPAKEA